MNAPIPYAPAVSEPPLLTTVEPQAREYDNGARLALAGALLLVGSLLAISEQVRASLDGDDPGAGSALIDVLLAVSFLKGNDKYRGFAIFRIIAGYLFFSWLSLSEGDYFTPGLLAIGNGGLLLVLIGQPSRNRRILGTALFGAIALLGIAGLALQ